MKKFLTIIIPIIAVLAIILSGYLYLQLKKNPQTQVQKEINDLVDKVGKLMILPEQEIPTIATVSDPEVLKDQIFFTQAQKGDKVLIYTEAKKAILYSVSLNKIIDITPFNVGTQKTTTINTDTTPTTIKTPLKK